MNCQTSSLLTWPYYYQGKGMEELRQSLLYTTLELETTRLTSQEEINKREDELTHLKELLNKAIKDRDSALENYQKLLIEKLTLQQQHQQVNSGVSNIEDDPNPNPNPTQKPNDSSNNAFCSSDCEESIVSSPENDSLALPENVLRLISGKKPLPEKGKLLEEVMKAGPLLKTLLLAGPLPQWRHPPPPLEAFQIPPFTISTINTSDQIMINASNCEMIDKKRGYFDDSFSPQAKYQRLLLH